MSWGITEEQIKEINEFVSNNIYCGIIAPTGSGKSTTMVENLYKHGAERIFITEPTIPAAESLYRYMSGRVGKEKVGFAAEGVVKYNNSTNIIYCTAGHLRRKLLNFFDNGEIKSGDMSFCSVIIIDEAHNGSIDNDAITELWIKAAMSGVAVPRLVLASATLSRESTVLADLPLYQIKTKSYPVQLEYAPRDYAADSRELYTDLSVAIIAKHYEMPVPENSFSKWLVFCAGSGEVENVCSIIRSAALSNVNVLPVYSTLPAEQISKINDAVAPGCRNIIVATNIAEASITIDGLDAVFDSLTEKVSETSSSGGLRLVVKHISKSSAAQRKGRTGRTGPGFCYRMSTEKLFDGFEEQRSSEISRVPLTGLVIEFLNVGLNPEEMFADRVSKVRMRKTLKDLSDLNMIDKDKRVTEAGNFATRFPLSVQNSALIYNWMKLDKGGVEGQKYAIYPIIVLACLIDSYGPSYYFYPRKDESMSVKDHEYLIQQHHRKYFKQYESDSDLKSMLLMWNDMMSEFKSQNPPTDMVFKWCQSHSLNNKKIQEVIKVVRKCCGNVLSLPNDMLVSLRNLEDADKPINVGVFNEDNFLNIANKVLIKSYKSSIFNFVKDGVYIDNETKDYYKLDKRQSFNPKGKTNYTRIIGIRTAQIGTGKKSKNVISLFYPI